MGFHLPRAPDRDVLNAAEHGDLEVLSRIMAKGITHIMLLSTWGGNSAWHKAAKGRHIAALKLMAAGITAAFAAANQKQANFHQKDALLAKGSSAKEVISCLLNTYNDKGLTPLMLAVAGGDQEIVRWMLLQGADATIRGRSGMTALHGAVAANDLESVRSLLDTAGSAYFRGVRLVDIEDFEGLSPLHYATYTNHLDMMRLLLSYQADLCCKAAPYVDHPRMSGGDTPMHLAAFLGRTEAVRVLLQAYYERCSSRLPDGGPEPRIRDPRRVRNMRSWLPYHVAARTGHTWLCEMLDPSVPVRALLPDDVLDAISITVPRLATLAAKALHKALVQDIHSIQKLVAKETEAAAAMQAPGAAGTDSTATSTAAAAAPPPSTAAAQAAAAAAAVPTLRRGSSSSRIRSFKRGEGPPLLMGSATFSRASPGAAASPDAAAAAAAAAAQEGVARSRPPWALAADEAVAAALIRGKDHEEEGTSKAGTAAPQRAAAAGLALSSSSLQGRGSSFRARLRRTFSDGISAAPDGYWREGGTDCTAAAAGETGGSKSMNGTTAAAAQAPQLTPPAGGGAAGEEESGPVTLVLQSCRSIVSPVSPVQPASRAGSTAASEVGDEGSVPGSSRAQAGCFLEPHSLVAVSMHRLDSRRSSTVLAACPSGTLDDIHEVTTWFGAEDGVGGGPPADSGPAPSAASGAGPLLNRKVSRTLSQGPAGRQLLRGLLKSFRYSFVRRGSRVIMRDSVSSRTADADALTCGVCLDAMPTARLMPCNHQLCADCALGIVDLYSLAAAACPFCRGVIRGFAPCNLDLGCVQRYLSLKELQGKRQEQA